MQVQSLQNLDHNECGQTVPQPAPDDRLSQCPEWNVLRIHSAVACALMERIKKNAMIHHLPFVKCISEVVLTLNARLLPSHPGTPFGREARVLPLSGTHHELYGGS